MVERSETASRVETFGCRLNAYESQVIRDHLDASADLHPTIVINTCAVTAEAERQARQSIRRARRESPEARIVVTGCAAQIDPDGFAAMPEVDRVVGNEEKLRAETWAPHDQAQGDQAPVVVQDIMVVRETAPHLVSEFEGRARAFVQVQQGCDHRCTFCIIPFGRGNSRSVPIGAIVDHVRAVVAQGYNEVVLTGVDISSYGGDLPGAPSLGQMMRRLLALVPDLPRLRLSSIDPVEIDPDLMRLIAEEPRLMPYLHLSVQAGDDMILKRMKRRHTRDDIIRLVERVRALRPETSFGCDVIAGFPTETESMFANTRELIRDLGFPFTHVFPYSPRPGTPAARMPQVPGPVRKARAADLRAVGQENLDRWLAGLVGGRDRVVVERNGVGRGEAYAPIALDPSLPVGDVVGVRLDRVEAGRLVGLQDGWQAA
ncbi:MAG: tRNA (N(6)-L-threonylcarbamoyladenosine(37)-C(2))-methylthiotransferase MtaB [Alphaproteobacteria bacterium]|nr:tRNA (N(6)-L-threonylcarbamoyladenosine(37)-C(2))-methylthiotransferase MtaB [Alphaproteobacteria bacterium]